MTIQDDLRKIKKDLYDGNGQHDLSITARLALSEDRMGRIEDSVADIKKTAKTIAILCVGTILTVIGNIISQHVK